MKKLSMVLLVFMFSISSAYAGCWYAGKEYPEGAIVNGYTCTANGSWG
jgi:hypothetical protein